MPAIDTNILASPFSSLLSTPSAPVGERAPTAPPKHREFGDAHSTRKAIYDNVLHAAIKLEPISNKRHTLKLSNVRYIDPEDYSKADHKRALLEGRTLSRRLKGTWSLHDNETGKEIDRRDQVIAHVPYVTHLGTFVHNGSDYTLNNQQRLKAGIFTRVQDNGDTESHANFIPGRGVSHRYYLDPEKGTFHVKLGQARLPLMPLVRAMGATDAQLRQAWGADLLAANYPKDDPSALKKLSQRILRPSDLASEPDHRRALVKRFEAMELDPEVNGRTLGKPHKAMNLDAILDTTKKLIAVSHGEQDVDDRDSLAYQTFHGPEDLLPERLTKDHGRLRRSLLTRATFKGGLQSMPSSALNPQLEAALLHSGLGQPIEEINPGEIFDKQSRITRMGEGGIPSLDSVPDEARDVQPSHLAFMDPIRTPESFRVGVDVHLARGARKGADGKIYSEFRDPKTGKTQWLSPDQVADRAVAFPGALKSGSKRIAVMKSGKLDYVPRDQVELEVPHFENSFSPLANLIPLKSMVKGQRVAMGSRMLTQALPLVDPEAPLVQSGVPGSGGARSFEEEYARHMGAVHAEKPGQVESVSPDSITLKHDDGTRSTVELYNNLPFNRKTFFHQEPAVQPGDTVKPGQPLARSNFTDAQGVTALGKNFRTAYVPWKGMNFEDAVVISESAAKRLTSEHMYQHELPTDEKTKTGKKAYISLFPGRFDRRTLDMLDDNGVIRPGTPVEHGHPLILAARERDRGHNKVHKPGQAGHADRTITWDHHDPGIVTDVAQGKDGPVVVVKSRSQMQVGDKLSGVYGDKGVVSAIIPDHKMPHTRDGHPFEALLNPLGVISRTNPAQLAAAALGKIAAQTGRPYKLEDFGDVDDMTEFSLGELAKHGMPEFEPIVDPESGRLINPGHYVKDPQTGKLKKVGEGVFTGQRFLMKLHHTSESKGQGRDSGAYSMDETPAKGGASSAKRVALLDVNALLSHGATQVLRDAGAVRGQKNDELWLQFLQGHNPHAFKTPLVYDKFIHQLKASGINVVRHGSQLHIMALTRPDVDALAEGRHLTSGETVHFDKDLKPVSGGLFDPGLTGSHGGRKWSAIELHEPMPSPVMEEPIRRLLGLTQKQYEGVIAGTHRSAGGTGAQAIGRALETLNVPREMAIARAHIKNGTLSQRDAAVRKLGYLKTVERLGMSPQHWMLDKAPVLPPLFRPVSLMGESGLPLVSDANFLYKELFEANKNLQSMHKEVGDEGVGAERLAVYHALKAVTGLGDPIGAKTKEKNVRGILKSVFGSSPKLGAVQRKLISSTVDNVGRAVITPNSAYDMDTVGLPEDRAFDVYQKFVVRRLKRRGLPVSQALRAVKDKTDLARQALQEEMEHRPVIVNRAPVLHRFGIMAFRPQLVKGSTVQVSPLVTKGFNADFDGDAVNFHVVSDEAARLEALDRMLPSRALLNPSDFKSPVHVPGQEYVGGLYTASSRPQGRKPRVFNTKEDAIRAYRRGEIRVDDPVVTLT